MIRLACAQEDRDEGDPQNPPEIMHCQVVNNGLLYESPRPLVDTIFRVFQGIESCFAGRIGAR